MYTDQEFIEEILQEISLSNVRKNTIIKSALRVDKPTVFLTFPDTNVNIEEYIYKLGFLTTNCNGVIAPNSNMKIGQKMFHGRKHFVNLKKSLLNTEEKTSKKLRVQSDYPIKDDKKTSINNNKQATYWFYDLTIYTEYLKYLNEKFNTKMATIRMFDEIMNIRQTIKTRDPSVNCEPLFIIKNTNGCLYEIIKKFRILIPPKEFEKMNLFDNYSFVHINGLTLPIFNKENGKNKIILQNINKSIQLIDDVEQADNEEKPFDEESDDIKATSITASTFSKTLDNSKLSGIVANIQNIKTTNTFNEDGNLEVGLDQDKLSQILKKYKITDPDIIMNVKIAIEQYLDQKKDKLTKEEAELVVLKAINKSVHGKDEIDEEYLLNPEKLLKKAISTNIYKTELNMWSENGVYKPEDIVDLKHTTGVWRQKFEFEETIHENVRKLFKSIEDVTDYPVSVKNIKHEIVDDDINRFIKYTITLQNTSGGETKPYDVELHIPSPVNDRYFKIRGTSYIMSSQQFFKPVTKTETDQVRILTNYAPVQLSVRNLKFNPRDISDIVYYIKQRYSQIIKESNDEYVLFRDNSKVYLKGSTVYESADKKIYVNKDTAKLTNQDGEQLKYGKYEYLYELLLEKIGQVNPDDQLTKTKKSIPFINIYIGSFRMPFILYLWQLKGLISTLNDLSIDYTLTSEPSKNAYYTFTLENNEFLEIHPNSIREKLLVNGLITMRYKNVIKNPNDPTEIHDYIDKTYGQRALYTIRLVTQNEIDPVSKELLEFDGLPTDLPKLLSGPCIDKLMNDKVDSLSDLKLYRSRMSEVTLNIMYSQIKAAHNEYTRKIAFNEPNQRINLDPNFIINDLIGKAGVMEFAEPVNPVDEVYFAGKVIKTGTGGVPTKRAFKIEHRNIHPSHYGNISPHSTPESGTVGLITQHTLNPLIINNYGTYGNRDINSLNSWQSVNINEALVPFQNQLDSDRLVMASIHGKQTTPTDGNEPPLIGTGGEFIVPQISSKRFIHIAKKDGVIEEVNKNKTVKVKYKDGTTDVFDIIPRMSRTKMGMYVSLELDSLQPGEKFKKNQPVAFTKNFDKNGIYCSGKNVFLAIMNYHGYSHEDGYCISQEMSESMSRNIVKQITCVIPPNTKVIKFEKEKHKFVSNKDILVEFSYDQDIEEYLDANDLMNEEDTDEVINSFSKGNDTIKLLAQEGEIIDVKIFINNKNSIDKTIVYEHNKMVKDVKKVVKELESAKTNKWEAIDNLDLRFTKTGGHKLRGGVEFLGAKIVYSIKQKKSLNLGDKIAGRYGNKGVISKVLSKEMTPKGEFVERIDVFQSPSSLFARKNIAILKELYIGKIMYYLNEQVIEMYNKNITTDKIINYVMDVYKLISDKDTYEKMQKNIKDTNPKTFVKNVADKKIKLFFIVPLFKDISFKKIKEAADFINIPLDEKVYIPELETWTKEEVPVGVLYYQALEQTAEIYSNVRSVGKYQGLTRQATKGKSNEGGQSIGNLDVYALLSYDAHDVLTELITLRSDDHKSKRDVVNQIISTGTAKMPQHVGGGGSASLMKTFMLGMGLYVK